MPLPYRDELVRLTLELEARRQALGSTSSRIEIAEKEREEIGREVEALEHQVAQARRRLRVLDDVQVATPCHAAWKDMAGDDRVRFCGTCEKNVYNLSAMSEAEAEAFVEKTEGNVCIRFHQRADGTMLTSDCPEGRRARRFRRVVGLAVGGVALSGVGLTALAGMCSMGEMRRDLPPAIQKPAPPPAEVTHRPVSPTPDPTISPRNTGPMIKMGAMKAPTTTSVQNEPTKPSGTR